MIMLIAEFKTSRRLLKWPKMRLVADEPTFPNTPSQKFSPIFKLWHRRNVETIPKNTNVRLSSSLPLVVFVGGRLDNPRPKLSSVTGFDLSLSILCCSVDILAGNRLALLLRRFLIDL